MITTLMKMGKMYGIPSFTYEHKLYETTYSFIRMPLFLDIFKDVYFWNKKANKTEWWPYLS